MLYIFKENLKSVIKRYGNRGTIKYMVSFSGCDFINKTYWPEIDFSSCDDRHPSASFAFSRCGLDGLLGNNFGF